MGRYTADMRTSTTECLGIMGAMPEEIDALIGDIDPAEHPSRRERAGRVFHVGRLHGRNVVVVFSRWGKVAAAGTAAELIVDFRVSAVVFFGIAGSLGAARRGDVVVAQGLVQHDLDASPFFPPTQVPMLGRSVMPTDPVLAGALAEAAEAFVREDLKREAPAELLARAEVDSPTVHRGVIASGDRVIFGREAGEGVLERVPGALCVEMEGAAAAQVCFEHGVPFGCVRTVSDSADESGGEHVKPFFEGLAGVYTRGVVRRWLGGHAGPGAAGA